MKTCFAMKLGKCVATENGCNGYALCPFYKTKERSDADRREAFERIAGLPLPEQVHISEKYYGGKYPWMVANTEA